MATRLADVGPAKNEALFSVLTVKVDTLFVFP